MTWPDGTVLLFWDTTLLTFRPEEWSFASACLSGRLLTGGTVTLPGPEETVSVTVEPLSTLRPAWIDWWMTMFWAVWLGTSIVVTFRLSSWRIVLAFPTV